MSLTGLLLGSLIVACITDAELDRVYLDQDADGYRTTEVGGPDCNDADPNINPNTPEICNDGVDNNCDGAIDDDGVGSEIWHRDEDDDQFGLVNETLTVCPGVDPGEGWSDQPGDCDDLRSDIYPSAPEPCDGRDNDCDSIVDEGC